MSLPKSISAHELISFMRKLRVNIAVKSKFSDQVTQIDEIFSNDKTGIISTIVDFMVHASTVTMKIETESDNLNDFMSRWQSRILNRNVNIDIPGGMRELSAQYFKERWRSSLIALQVIWGEEKLNNDTFIVPKKMWFLNGGVVQVENNGALNTKKYFIKNRNNEPVSLGNSKTKSTFIRRPYNAWHDDRTTPYLVRRGALFNGLFKTALKMKQSDLIEAIIPYLLEISAGTDAMTQYAKELLPAEEDFKKLKDKLVDSKEKWNETRNLKELIATLRYDVKLGHLIPDLTKFINSSIMQPIDRDLLSSLGMIELVGFSSNREEAILNPKVLIEEVADGVADWASLLEDVMFEMLERNKNNFPKLVNNDIKVIPGTVKSFITDDMRSMIRSLYDRGVVSKQNVLEDLTGLNFEVQVNRRKRETEKNLEEILEPPVTQNLGEQPDLENQDKKPGTPEADNFNQARVNAYLKNNNQKTKVVSSFENIDELPEDIKKYLPVPAQVIWLKAFNNAIKNNDSEKEISCIAWEKVSEKYKPGKKDKWIKK